MIIGYVCLDKRNNQIHVNFFREPSQNQTYTRDYLKEYKGTRKIKDFYCENRYVEEINYGLLGRRVACLFNKMLEINHTVSPHLITEGKNGFFLTINFLLSVDE